MLTVAICSYNRAERLPALVKALRAQPCPIPFEILIINNSSTDNTAQVLEGLAREPGVSMRFVTEPHQGICYARNRAIAESLQSRYLVFIDDDELPDRRFIVAAFEGLQRASCVGGKIKVRFSSTKRPTWLGDELVGFLGYLDYGEQPFSITDESTPIWTGNVAYRVEVFRDHPELRFDLRYNRTGRNVGGGEDAILFRALLKRGVPMRYCPDMVVEHCLEAKPIQRSYFLKLHYSSGVKRGRWEMPRYPRNLFGIPLFLFHHWCRQSFRALALQLLGKPGVLRQAMTAAHALGMMVGCHARWREKRAPGATPHKDREIASVSQPAN